MGSCDVMPARELTQHIPHQLSHHQEYSQTSGCGCRSIQCCSACPYYSCIHYDTIPISHCIYCRSKAILISIWASSSLSEHPHFYPSILIFICASSSVSRYTNWWLSILIFVWASLSVFEHSLSVSEHPHLYLSILISIWASIFYPIVLIFIWASDKV